MKLRTTLLSATLSFASLTLSPTPTLALTPQEISQKAESVTVRISHPNAPNQSGSGVIIDRNGNRYTVLTNCHVIPAAEDNSKVAPSQYRLFPYGSNRSEGYEFQAISECESFRQPADSPNISWQVDMVVLQFNSSENFAVADLAETASNRAETIYVAGYPQRNGRVETQANFRFDTGRITGIIQQNRQGYEIVHNASTRSGMSGGPILNQQGELVALNGLTQPDLNSLQQDYYGISVRLYREWQRNNRFNRNETFSSLGQEVIAQISQEITVVIIAEELGIVPQIYFVGSGTLINKNEEVYTVATACYVVTSGEPNISFYIKTLDKIYRVVQVDQNGELCLLRFASQTDYKVASLFETDLPILSGNPVFLSGYARSSLSPEEVNFVFEQEELTQVNSLANRINFTGNYRTLGAMGGPILNHQGKLIGIRYGSGEGLIINNLLDN